MSPHLSPNRTDCVRVQRSVISIVNWLVRDSSSLITSPRVIVNHTPSARVIIVFDNNLYYLHLIIYIYIFFIISGSGARVTVNGMSGDRSTGNASTLFDKARGTLILGRFRSIDAHDEHKGFKLKRTGNPSKIQETPPRWQQPMEKCKQMRKQQFFVHDLELFVTVQLLEDTPTVMRLENSSKNIDFPVSGPAVDSHIRPNN